MLQQQDSVGLVTFDTKVRRYIPPRARPRHMRAIIKELQKQKPGQETELGGVRDAAALQSHRAPWTAPASSSASLLLLLAAIPPPS